QMEELGRRCEAIGEILVYVDHLTGETSTLSINATIKAADGGAGGDSRQKISAMAREVQKLAELAQGRTRGIRQPLEESRLATDASQAGVGERRGQVERCRSAFEEVEQHFGRIRRWVDDAKRGAQRIEAPCAR